MQGKVKREQMQKSCLMKTGQLLTYLRSIHGSRRVAFLDTYLYIPSLLGINEATLLARRSGRSLLMVLDRPGSARYPGSVGWYVAHEMRRGTV